MSKTVGFLGKRPSSLLHSHFIQRSSGNAIRSRLGWRSASTQVGNTKRSSVLLVASGGILLALGLSPFYTGRAHADSETQLTSKSNETPLGALIRSYAVYTMCSIPALVDHSPKILELASMPGLKWITEAFVRITFFDQFVGGDTAQKTVPLLHSLRATNKGALFGYSVEVDEADATAFAQSHPKHKGPPPHKRIVDEMIRCIDVAADFEDSFADKSSGGRRTWVAIKMVRPVTIMYSHDLNLSLCRPLWCPMQAHSSDYHPISWPPAQPRPHLFPSQAAPVRLILISSTNLSSEQTL
jgi:proline dehydrogenase